MVAEMDFHKGFFYPLVSTGGVTIASESENNSFLPFTEELYASSQKVFFRVVTKRQMGLWNTLSYRSCQT